MPSLQRLSLHGMEDEWTVYTGEEEFRDREDLRRIRVAPHVLAIPRDAFCWCRWFWEVDLANATEIGEQAFRGCHGLGEVDLSNVTEIGSRAFDSCTGLRKVALRRVTTIGSSAFSSCGNLTAVELPEGLRTIGEEAFSRAGLKSVAIPSTVTEIGDSVFNTCSNLAAVELPEGLQKIWHAAFGYCGLESVIIPSTVTEIGGYAFAFCTNLRAVTLCEGLKVIGQGAFTHCGELESVVIPSTVTEIKKGAFRHCPKLAAVELLGGTQTIHRGAFDDCDLERINIPSPAFAISAGGAGNTLRCHFLIDATISAPDLRMVVSKHVGCMSSDRLEEAERKINEILGETEEEEKEGQWQAQVRKLFEYYELRDATTALELAIWRAKMMDQSGQNARRRSTRKRARVDSSSHRNQCRTDSGAHIILPLVMPFVGPRIW